MFMLFMAHQVDMGVSVYTPNNKGIWYQIANTTAVR